MAESLSRRQLFSLFGPALHPAKQDHPHVVFDPRHCISYNGGFCSNCAERCPADGAITQRNHMPKFNADNCTACGDCLTACPAPISPLHLAGSS